MTEFIISLVPWWVWAIIGVAILVTLHRLVGWKGMIAGASVIAGILMFKRGQHVGASGERQKQKEKGDALQQHYDDITADNPPDLDRDIERLRRH